MAVSGRKLTDLPGPVYSCSKDYNCDPCLTIGQHIKAHGYCMDCQEYLCMNCFECHQRTKASKDHQLVKGDTDSGRSSNECTEKCHVHKKEFIKFFCKNHEVLGCTDCMTMDHRTCNLDYIPDSCAGIGESNECRQVIRELDRKVKEADNIIQQANSKNSKVDSSHENAKKHIIKFRKEMDDHLNEKQKKMELLADDRKSTEKQKIQRVLETCASVSSDMKEVQSCLQDNTTAKQDAQLYITIKRAKSKLSSNEIKDAEETLEGTNVSYAFEPSKDLRNILSGGLDDFGTLNSQSADSQRKKSPFCGLTFTRSIKTISGGYISGCAVLARNKVLLADYNTRTLIVVDTESNVIVEEKSLNSNPWDIAVLPQDQVAVTLPKSQEILIMSTAGKLSTVRKIQVKGKCHGITFGKDHFYVLCHNPASILSMDVQGKGQTNIFPNSGSSEKRYCVLSDASSTVYVTDYTSHSVLRLTITGEILSTFNHDDLEEPEGIVLLDDGSLLVCSYGKNTILHISSDLKQCEKVASVENPKSICYNHHQQEIYIGTYYRGLLLVFSLKYDSR